VFVGRVLEVQRRASRLLFIVWKTGLF